MIRIKTAQAQDILLKLSRIETRLDQFISSGDGIFSVFNAGLEAYRGRLLTETRASPANALLARIQRDSELRFPHRKILEFLSQQYDFAAQEFKEVFFSEIVRNARVGKNRAGRYLSLLERKGLVEKRHDGYRLFFKIRVG